MRLFILGATGNTGTQIVDLALFRGHEVTAFVRSPDKIKRRHPLLRVLPGDPHDVDELASALPGHDAVISALGVRPPTAATDIKELTLRLDLASDHQRRREQVEPHLIKSNSVRTEYGLRDSRSSSSG